ncbi:MAG TPA: APC family permease [Actinomycetota bacterium]|nr:APC family permease [Actinomycetota bacterium]
MPAELQLPRRVGGGPLKRLFVGRAIASDKAEHQLLPKFLALPVFSSDPLSSNAYATEEMMLVLVAAGAGALTLRMPIALAIAALLAIVVTSYRQTVRAYPTGGGSYIVARENLGTVPGLTAAAAILTDYVLTVAVSITAGTTAIASVAPETLVPVRVPIAIGLVALVTLANLRGVKEAGSLFAIPTYGFVLMIAITLVAGFVECLGGCPVADTANLPLEVEHTLSLFLIARAFSSGATALTGVEAIADGVPAFRRPQARNAATTLAVMGAMSITMFLGITALSVLLHVRITDDIAHELPVLAQIGDTVFGGGIMFLLLQVFTAGILILAANTAFQDFPRLASILARDRFMPSQFRNRGDRLVFSNGVVVLAGLAGLLIWAFDANLTRLIQLYVVGVFTAFTLSQAGMVRRWTRTKEGSWKRSAVINGIGAATTGVVLVVVTITKFTKGAWIVILAMPFIVLFFWGVHRHYEHVARALQARRLTGRDAASGTMLLLVPDLGLATRDAVAYLRAVRPAAFTALYVGPPDAFQSVAAEWPVVAPRMGALEPVRGADRHLVRSVRRYVRSMPRHERDRFLTVVIPELLPRNTVWQFLRHREAFLLKTALLFEPRVVVTDVPLVPSEARPSWLGDRPLEPERTVVLVPVSAVHDPTVRAVIYGKSLHPTAIEAIFMVTDPEEVEDVVDEWHERQLDVPLVLVEAPFRDFGPPLLEEIRAHTSRGDTIVTVVLPELVPRHWWENLLHNQTALFFKRVLLFEPGVVVTSVPFHLSAPEVGPDPTTDRNPGAPVNT